MLTERYANDELGAKLISKENFRPYATVDDRMAWQSLPKALRGEQVAVGERHLNQEWPPLPATSFMEFERRGDRSGYERLSFARRNALANLVIAECIEDAGRFMDSILDGIWAICEESFWGVPAHNHLSGGREPLPDTSQPIIDLFAAGRLLVDGPGRAASSEQLEPMVQFELLNGAAPARGGRRAPYARCRQVAAELGRVHRGLQP